MPSCGRVRRLGTCCCDRGPTPASLVAFPAGNSGVGIWFAPLDHPAPWHLDQAPTPTVEGGGRLHGIVATASIAAARLTPRQTVLSNVRLLRAYQSDGRIDPDVAATVTVESDTLRYRRRRLDDAPGYELRLRVLDGRIQDGTLIAGSDGRIRLEITALTGDTPLTPLPAAELLNQHAAADPAARNALTFLSYREKFLAGSWRFNTYFGRDTLMSVRLLMPALRSAAVEAGLNSVMARLSTGGEVAHEEGIGEFALLKNRRAGLGSGAPELDYGMVDDDYMLAPVVAEYLAGSGRSRANAYLARPLPSEARPGETESVGRTLVRNLRFVVEQASPFAASPTWSRLISIKPGRMSGQWRDSDEGLGRGIYPYDVNAALVPAALEGADEMLRAGLLDRYVTPADRAVLARAGTVAKVWRTAAAPLFRVEVASDVAARSIRTYGTSAGVPADEAVASLASGPLVFHALSIDATGKPVPVVNSDEGFVLLFGRPAARDLQTYVSAAIRPFPAGLMTEVGLLVANPAFATTDVQSRFSPAAYHGTVVWSWQQALFAAGLERQLERTDLPMSTRQTLQTAQRRLWRSIQASRSVQSSELWSWTFRSGRYQIVPFGAGKGDVDESNAAQLWSTVYLAVRPPLPATVRRRTR